MTGLCCCGCGRPAVVTGAGLPMSNACWKRWCRASRPASGPPAPMPGPQRISIAAAANQEAYAARLEDYAELRSWGETVRDAAARVGVSECTAWAYEHAIREGSARAA